MDEDGKRFWRMVILVLIGLPIIGVLVLAATTSIDDLGFGINNDDLIGIAIFSLFMLFVAGIVEGSQ